MDCDTIICNPCWSLWLSMLGSIMLIEPCQWHLITLFTHSNKASPEEHPINPPPFVFSHKWSQYFEEMCWKVFEWKLLGRPWSSQPVMNHALDQSGAAILAGARHCLPPSSFHLLPLHQCPQVGFPRRTATAATVPLQDQTPPKWVLFSPLQRQVSSSLHCLCSWYLLVPIC